METIDFNAYKIIPMETLEGIKNYATKAGKALWAYLHLFEGLDGSRVEAFDRIGSRNVYNIWDDNIEYRTMLSIIKKTRDDLSWVPLPKPKKDVDFMDFNGSLTSVGGVSAAAQNQISSNSSFSTVLKTIIAVDAGSLAYEDRTETLSSSISEMKKEIKGSNEFTDSFTDTKFIRKTSPIIHTSISVPKNMKELTLEIKTVEYAHNNLTMDMLYKYLIVSKELYISQEDGQMRLINWRGEITKPTKDEIIKGAKRELTAC